MRNHTGQTSIVEEGLQIITRKNYTYPLNYHPICNVLPNYLTLTISLPLLEFFVKSDINGSRAIHITQNNNNTPASNKKFKKK